ncbi:LysR family transcriptional regulator [Catenulispora sp. NF23]|uniref:LysR family transcriptional regulator n=1 Tax=Catenulispora pinistramenti TaxID=2705254 RepID=UPI001BA9B011|nr:LysR family transcriptional regulator [Catenulispora pinistramenti]MBS2532521.1 LysR family transcriptional regulator [Catenulispora pinistramenti]
MDLALLRTFLAVHRAGSLTRAAASLGVSQPAVTAQIRTLEQRVGRELFVRLPRGVAPTAAADELARAVAPHLDALTAVAHETLIPDSGSHAVVRLGCPASLTTTLLLPALAPLMDEGLRVVVAGGQSEELVAQLAAGRLDLTLSAIPPRLPGVTVLPLADEEYALVGAPRWKPFNHTELFNQAGPFNRTGRVPVPVLDLAEDLPYIRLYWSSVFEAEPPSDAALVIPDLRGVLDAAVQGYGVAVLPRPLCAPALEAGTLVLLDEPEVPPIRTLFVAVRGQRARSKGVARVRDRLVGAASRW